MKPILLPILLFIFGSAAGVGGGLYLAPTSAEATAEHVDELADEHVADSHDDDSHATPSGREFARLNNQFVVPIVEDGIVRSLIVMSLNLEVVAGAQTAVFELEPKLRDGFLQALFNHANLGGFTGNFTAPTKMAQLRSDLLRVGQELTDHKVTDVLIIDLVRQDT